MKSYVMPYALVVGLLAGCGSTVAETRLPGSVDARGATGLGDAADSGGPVGSSTALQPDQAAVPGLEPLAPNQPATSPGAATGATPSSPELPAEAKPAPRSGRLKPIKVGIVTVDPTDSDGGSVGASDFSTGNTPKYWRAVIADANAHGGVGGHKVEPVFHLVPLIPADSRAEMQAACAKFTEDNRVSLAFNDLLFDEPLAACLSKQGVPLVHAQAAVDDVVLSRFPRTIVSAFPRLDRAVVSLAEGLLADKFFAPAIGESGRVGLIRVDDGLHERVVEQRLKPALLRGGVKIAAEQRVTSISTNEGDLATVSRAMSAAVLAFRSADVDRVLIVTLNATEPLLFMSAAESQGYRPYYGLTSQQAPAVLAANLPRQQAERLRGVGWAPVLDTDAPPLRPVEAACDRIIREAGAVVSQQAQRAISRSICDAFWLAVDAGRLIDGRGISGGLFTSAVETLGNRHRTPMTFSTEFRRGRHDGAQFYRAFAFSQRCSCLAYTTPATRIS